MLNFHFHNRPDNNNNKEEAAAERKTAKYLQLAQTYTFVPIAVETLGPMNSVGLQFLSDLGRRITQVSTDQRLPLPIPVSFYPAF